MFMEPGWVGCRGLAGTALHILLSPVFSVTHRHSQAPSNGVAGSTVFFFFLEVKLSE